MGLDVDKFQGLANRSVQEKQAQQNQPKPSLLDKAKAVGESALNTVENAADSAGEFIENTAGDINDAYHNMLNAQLQITGAYTNDAVQQANESGDYSQQDTAVSNLQTAGQRLVYSPYKEATRDIVNNYADDNDSSLQGFAQNLRRSTAYVDYYMTDDEKLSKAMDIQNETGINAQSILNDTEAYKKAWEIYDYTKKQKALGGSMEDVWNEFPGLKDIAQVDPQSAALALHDINSVRQTKTIIDSFTKMLEYGNMQLEYKNLNYKLMNGRATDDDKARIADLSKQLEEDEPVLPSFLDNPLAYVAAGVAGSAPEMIQSMGQMANDFAVGALAGAAAGVALGGVGAAPGAIGAGITNAARAYAMRQAAITGARVMGGYAARYGMFEGMYEPETGGYFAQFKDMKDKNGKPLLSYDAARNYAKVAGALNAGIEMANFEVVKKALLGNVYKDTVKTIINKAQSQATAAQALREFAANRAAAVYDVTASETLEEGAQSISDDLVHNQIENDTGDTSNKVFTAKDITAHAVSQMGQAIPGAIGFGMISSLSGGIGESTGLSRNLVRAINDNAKLDANARKTYSGAMMVEQLQDAVQNSKLKNTAPAIQEKLIRKQLQGTGFEMAYVDIETAIKKESGQKDLESLAKVAGYTPEDLQAAVNTQGILAVPVEKFAQAETSPDILQAVSFDKASEPLGKLHENAKEITKQMNELVKRDIDNQITITDAIVSELFPAKQSTQEERDTVQSIIYTNPENPSAGWRTLYNGALEEKAALLAPALNALKNGMGNGVDIVQETPGTDNGVRVSKNAKWYQEFYKQHKRAPTNAELEDMASDLMTGKPTAPQVANWIPTTPGEQKSLQENEQALSAINTHIKNMENIKNKMSALTGVEMRITHGLSQEGYFVYRRLTGQLQKAGGRTARAARMDAILFARHADIVAKIMSGKTGKEYTALDYYKNRFGLTSGLTSDSPSIIFNQKEADKKLRQDEQNFAKSVDDFMNNKLSGKNINVMTTPLVMKLAGAPVLPIRMNKSILYKILKGKHSEYMHPEIVKQVPRALTDPMMILHSFDDKGNIIENEHIVVLDLKDTRGKSVIVPFIFNTKSNHYSINKIKSIYGRTSNNWIAKQLNEKDLLYINKKKTTDWAQSIGAHNGSQRHSTISNLFFNIPNEHDLVKLKKVNSTLYQNDKGSIGKMPNGQRIISLYETADESTFVHEMGHMFLMDLDDLAQIDETSRKELDIVNEWAQWKEKAAEEYRNTPWYGEFATRQKNIVAAHDAGDIKTEISLKEQWRQERFARAFEMYLKKGTAPAKGLKAVFRKFKSYLRDIYIGFTSTGGSASPKVEAVMKRMIATEEEIDEAALDDRYRDITAAGGEKLLNEKEEDTYKRWHEEAKAEAKEKLMSIVMNDLREETQRKFAERITAERERKQTELANEDIYIAQEAVKQSHDKNIVLNWYPDIKTYEQKLKNTLPLEKVLNDYMNKYEKQLDTDIIDSHMTNERIAQAMESTPYHRKLIAMENSIFAEKGRLINRIDSKVKMAMQDVNDKIEALPDNADIIVDQQDKSVKAMMQAINRLRFSSKWTAKDLAKITSMINSKTKEDVQEALNNFKSSIHEETVNRKEIERAAEGKLQLYREQAQKTLQGKPITQSANFAHYRKSEKIYAKRAQAAMKGKNWNLAMRQKEMQYVAAAMAQQAKKNQEHIMKLIHGVENQLKTRIKLPAQEKYWHKHLAYLLRLTKDDANPPIDGIAKLEDIFSNLKDALDIEYVPTDILTMSQQNDFIGYQGLSIGEFEDATQALTILYTTGRDKFKLKTIKGKDIKDIVNEMISDDTKYISTKVIKKMANPDTGGLGYNDIVAKTPLIGQALAKGGAKYMAVTMKPESIIKMLGAKAHRYLYGTYERASRKEASLTSENVTKIKNILDDYSHKEKLDWKKKQYQLGKDKTDLFSKEQIICMAMNLGNEINKERLVMGLNIDITREVISESDVENFVYQHMDKKDWLLVQNIWDHLHSFWDDTGKIEQELNGVTLKPVAPKPFDVVLNNGETIHMSGGYYPIAADPEKNIRTEEKTIEEAARKQMSGAQVLGTGRGFIKARSEHQISRMMRLDFGVIPEHLGSVIHNISFRLAARDVFRLVNDENFSEYVQGKLGKEAYKAISQWATDVWKILPDNTNQAASLIEKSFASLRRNATMAIMGYRLYPVLENVTNIFPIMDKLGAAKALSAVGDFYANSRECSDLLHKSIFMRNRINNMDRDIKNIPGLFDEDHLATGWLKEHAYSMMLYSDLMFSAPLWSHAYKDAYQDKLTGVIKENEANKKEFAEAQKNLSDIRAKIIDLNRNNQAMAEELENRKFMFSAEQLNPNFAAFRDEQLHAQTINADEDIKNLKEKLFDAKIRLDKAADLKILDEQEMLKETEQRSIETADSAVRDVFGSGEIKDLASIQKGPEIAKLFTAFYSFFNTQANAILDAYYKGKYDNGSNFTRWMPAAKAVLYRIVLTSAMSTVLRMALLGDGSDDKNKYRKEKDADGKEKKIEIPLMERFLNQFGKNTLSTAAGTLWGLRDIASFYINEAFDGTDYGRGIDIAGVATQAGQKIAALSKLVMEKGDRDLKIADAEAKETARYRKMTKKQRQKYDAEKQYKNPVKRITYTDIAKAAGGVATSMTAAKTGITDTMANTVLTTMQYMNDTDGRYDPSLKNIIWSALFDKKPVAREVPSKPEPPKKIRKGEMTDDTITGDEKHLYWQW